MKKPSPKNDQQESDRPQEASSELDTAVPEGRHWLKYAGIGARRPKNQGEDSASGGDVTSLGSLEAEVLGLLWEIGHPATGMEVMETSLYKRRAQGEEPAAFATIATTLRRLTAKGVLRSQKNDARTPVYWPTMGREQMAARILDNVSQTLLGISLHGLLPRLIGGAKTQPSQSGANQVAEADQVEEEQDVERLMRALEEVAEAHERRVPEKE